MAIVDDIISSLRQDAPLQAVHHLSHFVAVKSDSLGLACRLSRGKEIADAFFPPPELSSVRELAQYARATVHGQAALGLAGINSLLQVRTGQLCTENAYQRIVTHGMKKNVTIVGHFPFVDQLRPLVKNLWVLELDPQKGDLAAQEAPRVIPDSAVVAISATTMINHTLDALLQLARGKYIVLLGPSTPLSPVLLDHGVNALCGAVFDDPAEVLRGLGQGMSFRQAAGLRRVIMER